ncbi:MAG: hypothetical protein AMJ75_10295 [Phycisphaerae bacterium SM1_79]|nr:MAG: hypothetical protein AMJ75_10295 [Phycisphaerae bacterium SM1_79]
MLDENQKAEGSIESRRHREWEKFARIFSLIIASFHVTVFILIARTGYLSRIGFLLAAVYVTPGIASPLAGFAGKKRLESFLSWLNIGAPILLALVVATLTIWPVEGSDGGWKPYAFDADLTAFETKRAIPSQENAALRYESVFTAIDVNDFPDSFKELWKQPWKREDYPEVSLWIDSHSKTIDELLQIGKMETCRWPIHADIYEDWTVPYKPLSYCVELISVSANRNIGEARYDNALEMSFCMLQMAEHLYQQTNNLDFTFGFNYERAALSLINHILILDKVSEKGIEQIANRLPTAKNNLQEDIARLLSFDELRFARLMAPLYEINEQGKIRFAASLWFLPEDRTYRNSRLWRLYWLINMPLNPQGVWDMAKSESAKFSRFLELGPSFEFGKDEEDSFWLFLDFTTRTVSNGARLHARDICFDKIAYAHFGERYATQMTRRRETWLVLGLRKYRNAHGEWPESLDLISEYVPGEAFLDPTNNDAIVYALEGDGFRLYSKGPNGIDEGGRNGFIHDLKTSEDDITIWPLKEKGARK